MKCILKESGSKGTLKHSSSSEAGTTGHLVASMIAESVPLHPKERGKGEKKTSALGSRYQAMIV
jgi:hypothetical protein